MQLKNSQGTVISVIESWYHIFKYPEVITNLNFLMIQTTMLETRTINSLQNPDNPTSNNFTQSDDNVTNNPENEIICLNELRHPLSINCCFTKSQSSAHEDMQLYKTSCNLDPITRFSLRPPVYVLNCAGEVEC